MRDVSSGTSAPKSLWENAAEVSSSRYDWRWMLRSVIGQPMLLACATVIGLIVAGAIIYSRTPIYSASTTLHITNLRLSMNGRDDAYFAESHFDPTFLETQIQIIASETIAKSVIARLAPAAPKTPSLIEQIKTYLSSFAAAPRESDAQSNPAGLQQAALLRRFTDSLSVQRIGQSNLVEIRFSDASPTEAAKFANETAREYLDKINADRIEAAQAASSWLRDRLQEIGPKGQIVSEARIPTDKGGTRNIVILIVTTLLGVVTGLFVALMREFLNTTVRSPEQFADICGVECLGMVPQLKRSGSVASRMTWVLRFPFSPLWQSLRQASVIVDGTNLSRPLRYVGFTSTLPGEGKTFMASNFAAMMAGSGKNVLLIDAQPYNPSLSGTVPPKERGGLFELMSDEVQDVASYVFRSKATGLDVLSIGNLSNPSQTAQRIWSDGMERFLAKDTKYDLMVFDLPPMIAGGDLRAAASHLDGLFYIAAWGARPEAQIRSAINLIPNMREKMLGVILNKVKLSGLRRVSSSDAAFLAQQSLLVKKS